MGYADVGALEDLWAVVAHRQHSDRAVWLPALGGLAAVRCVAYARSEVERRLTP